MLIYSNSSYDNIIYKFHQFPHDCRGVFFNRIFLNNKCKPQTGGKLRNRQLIQGNAWFGGDFLYIYILLRIANELGQIEVETDPDSILGKMQISSDVVIRRLSSTDSRLVWRKSQFFSSLWFAFILEILIGNI